MISKTIIPPEQPEISPPEQDWLNLEELAEVEITSEDDAHPIDYALLPDQNSGWRAAGPGKQTIRILFLTPQTIRRIWLNFVETDITRTQEYVLRWSSDAGQSFQTIVRQQWNFSPDGATCEIEDHHVNLPSVSILELTIVPDISDDQVMASLEQLRLG